MSKVQLLFLCKQAYQDIVRKIVWDPSHPHPITKASIVRTLGVPTLRRAHVPRVLELIAKRGKAIPQTLVAVFWHPGELLLPEQVWRGAEKDMPLNCKFFLISDHTNGGAANYYTTPGDVPGPSDNLWLTEWSVDEKQFEANIRQLCNTLADSPFDPLSTVASQVCRSSIPP